MRHLLFSDVHGNLEALEALLAKIYQEKPDKAYFLGDAVGYGANPSECLQGIIQIADFYLLGNHDAAMANLLSLTYFNPAAKEALLWTQNQLLPEEKSFLKSWPLILQFPEFCLVHSSPLNPSQWDYLLTEKQAEKNFGSFSSPLCFIGHTHSPEIIKMDFKCNVKKIVKLTVDLKENYRYIINVGSVGQPRDYNPKAAYCLYDDNKNTIQIQRIEYNIEKAQRKILQAGLPPILADRLSMGI